MSAATARAQGRSIATMVHGRLAASVVMTMALLVAGGCGSAPSPEIEHYWISPGGRAKPTTAESGPVLYMAQTAASPHLSGITIRRPDARTDNLIYHRWAATLPQMVGEWVRGRLTETGAFRLVLPEESIAASDLTFHLYVESFEIVEEPGQSPEARVALQGTVFKAGSRRLVWSKRTEAARAVEGGGVPYLVSALEQALIVSGGELSTELARHLELAAAEH